MKKLITALLIGLSFACHAQITIGAHTGIAGNGTTATTSSINTAGASAIVVQVGAFNIGVPGTLSDNKGNTWTLIRTDQNTASVADALYYCAPCTVGSGHTFTYTKGSFFPDINVLAINNTTTTPLDQQNGTFLAAGTSVQPGSVTPGSNNEIILTGIGTSNTGGTPTINSGFTISNSVAFGTGNNQGAALAYLIQTTASSVNPTWSWSTSTLAATGIITLRFAANNSGILLITQ